MCGHFYKFIMRFLGFSGGKSDLSTFVHIAMWITFLERLYYGPLFELFTKLSTM